MGCGAGAARTSVPNEATKTQSPESTKKELTSKAEQPQTEIGTEPVANLLPEVQTHPAELDFGSIQTDALRRRLVSMGEHMSVEVAPGSVDVGVAGAADKGPKKLLQLQAQYIAEGKPPVLRDGMPVFVNMVKTSMDHFEDVKDATQALVKAGFSAYPHLPAARFETAEECRSTVVSLAGAGASQLLVVGGNDLQERVEAKLCAYSSGACGLMASELATFQTAGVKTLAVAGHPDGHPGLAWDEAKTATVLLQKARPVLEAGLNIVVATQFCFDARKLVRWLKTSREALLAMRAEIMATGKTCGTVAFCMGVPGPTPRNKLERIASICEVPSLFISSAFDLIDSDQDGVVTWEDFQEAVQKFNLSRRSVSKLATFFDRHADEVGVLGPVGFSNMLLDDAVTSRISFKVELPSKPAEEAKVVSGPSKFVDGGGADKVSGPPAVSGPSKFVDGGGADKVGPSGPPAVAQNGSGKSDTSGIVWPDELVLTLASYCEHYNVQAGEVMLHFFPFGGLAKTFELISSLQAGTWPKL